MKTRTKAIFIAAAIVVVPVASIGLYLAVQVEEPVARGSMGETFAVRLDMMENVTVDISVDSAEPVSQQLAEEWDIREFADSGREEAADLRFVRVEFTVTEVRGRLTQEMTEADDWALATEEGSYEGRVYQSREEADCSIERGCLFLAVPADEVATGVHFTNVENSGSLKHRILSDGRFVSWTIR